MQKRVMKCKVCGVEYLDDHTSCTFCREPIDTAEFVRFNSEDKPLDSDLNNCDEHRSAVTSESYSSEKNQAVGGKLRDKLYRFFSKPSSYAYLILIYFLIRFAFIALSLLFDILKFVVSLLSG